MRTILELFVTPFSFEDCFVDSSGRAWATLPLTSSRRDAWFIAEKSLPFTSTCLSTHDSFVVIMTKWRVGRPDNRCSIVGRERYFVFFSFQTGPGFYPVCPQEGTKGFFFRKQRSRGERMTSSHNLVQGNSILPSFLRRYGTILKHRENLTLHLHGRYRYLPLYTFKCYALYYALGL